MLVKTRSPARVRGSQVAQLSAVRRYAVAATAFGSFRSPPIAALIQDPSLDPDPPPGVLHHIQAVLPSLNSSTSFGTHLADTLFSLDREFTFINHGAFGAALQPLQLEAEAWRQRSESGATYHLCCERPQVVFQPERRSFYVGR
jgi:hypothetical protein